MLNRFERQTLLIFCISTIAAFALDQQGAASDRGASLHLVAAVTNVEGPGFDPKIYRLAQANELRLVRTLTVGNEGIDFIRPDFKSRRIVFAWPEVVPKNLAIIEMDSVGEPTILPLEYGDVPGSAWRPLPAALTAGLPNLTKAGDSVIHGYNRTLVDLPTGGTWLALDITTFRGKINPGYRLDSAPARAILDPNDLSHLRIQGDFGIANQLGDSDAPWTFGHVRDGKVLAGSIDIGVPAPEGTNDPKVQWRLVAHDGYTTIMYRHELPPPARGPFMESRLDRSAAQQGTALPTNSSRTDNCSTTLFIRNGQTGRWNSRQVPGLEPRIKMIDSWIMGAASCEALGRESPGAAERQRYFQHYQQNPRYQGRLATDDVLRANNTYLPGVLFLINVSTGRYLELRTDQGDSEILLVHDGTVYYRVNDTILSAPLQGDSVGKSKLLVQDRAIPDVHWAFWGSERESK